VVDSPALPLTLFAALALATLAFRADYYHLRQELPVTLVLVGWLLGQLRGTLLPTRLAAGAGVVVLALLVVPLFVSLSEAAHFRADQSHPLHSARGTVLVDETEARGLGALLSALTARTAPGEAIYVWPAETAVYFLADRRNPTRFGQLVSTELELLREDDGRRQHELLAATRAADVRWGVAAPTDDVNGVTFESYAPIIARAVDREYEPVQRFGYWTLQRRRSP
jgi:hypothetical protein